MKFSTWELRGEGRSLSINLDFTMGWFEVALVNRVYFISWKGK